MGKNPSRWREQNVQRLGGESLPDTVKICGEGGVARVSGGRGRKTENQRASERFQGVWRIERGPSMNLSFDSDGSHWEVLHREVT